MIDIRTFENSMTEMQNIIYQKAETMFSKNDYKGALSLYNKVASMINNPKIIWRQATCYYLLDDFKNGYEKMMEYLKYNKDHIDAYNMMSEIYSNKQMYTEQRMVLDMAM